MNNNEIDEITEPVIIINGDKIWGGFERDVPESGGTQHCFYCNFSLVCGQDECVWQEG